jgi:Cu2+-exporting ATPase
MDESFLQDDNDSCCDAGDAMVNQASEGLSDGNTEQLRCTALSTSTFSDGDGKHGSEDSCCKPSLQSQVQDTLATDLVEQHQRAEDRGCCVAIKNQKTAGRKSSSYVSVTPELADRPGCCKDKTSPCCDSTCLDQIALRECQDQRPVAQSHRLSKSE